MKKEFKMGEWVVRDEEYTKRTGFNAMPEGERWKIKSFLHKEIFGGDTSGRVLFDVMLEDEKGNPRVANTKHLRYLTETEEKGYQLKNLFSGEE